MVTLTARQQQILDFIEHRQSTGAGTPTLREIASRFGFRSMNSAVSHVRALKKKGVLSGEPHRARALRVSERFGKTPSGPGADVVRIPIYGTIPAGNASAKEQEMEEGLVLSRHLFGGTRLDEGCYVLRVRGDSMSGKQIRDGDLVVLSRSKAVQNGDVVAALIDGESTLKTICLQKGKPVLRAENPAYPELIPADELTVQGVMIGLVRSGQ